MTAFITPEAKAAQVIYIVLPGNLAPNGQTITDNCYLIVGPTVYATPIVAAAICRAQNADARSLLRATVDG